VDPTARKSRVLSIALNRPWVAPVGFFVYILAVAAVKTTVSFLWPDHTPTPICGCFEVGGPWSCWVRDAGGSVSRLLAQWAAAGTFTALSFAIILFRHKRKILIAGLLGVFLAWILLDNVGLPHGGCSAWE
jgi:hypothetical protein